MEKTDKQQNSEPQPLCICPNCETGSLLELDKSYYCADCNFRLFKNMRGRNINRKEMLQLATEHQTGVLHGFVGKDSGKEYSGILLLKRNENDELIVNLTFPEAKILPCPCCEGGLHETQKTYRCDNESCGLVLWKTVYGKALSDTQIARLAESGKVQVSGLVSKKGDKFSGLLVLDKETKKVKVVY